MIDSLNNSESSLHERFSREYSASKKIYDIQKASEAALVEKGGDAALFNVTGSRAYGKYGYFEPRGDESFYEVLNKHPENEEGSVTHIDYKDVVTQDKEKNQIVFLVIMGSATIGEQMGADFTFSANLAKESVDEQLAQHFTGDCLESSNAGKILGTVKRYLKAHESDARPAILHTVFFRPLRGIGGIQYNLYALTRMFEELQKIYELLPHGGRIFFQAPNPEALDLLEELLEENGSKKILARHPTGSLLCCLTKNTTDALTVTPDRRNFFLEKLLRIAIASHTKRT